MRDQRPFETLLGSIVALPWIARIASSAPWEQVTKTHCYVAISSAGLSRAQRQIALAAAVLRQEAVGGFQLRQPSARAAKNFRRSTRPEIAV